MPFWQSLEVHGKRLKKAESAICNIYGMNTEAKLWLRASIGKEFFGKSTRLIITAQMI